MNYKHILRALILAAGVVVTTTTAPVALAAGQGCAILPIDCNASGQATNGDVSKTGVFQILVWVINILTVGVGMVAVGVVVYAGILYTSAGGSNEQVAKAKSMITNMVIGVIAYALMYFALNWLIPGGVIG